MASKLAAARVCFEGKPRGRDLVVEGGPLARVAAKLGFEALA